MSAKKASNNNKNRCKIVCYDIMYERKSTVKAMKMAYTNQYRNTLVEDFLLQYTTICFCTRLMIIIIPTNYSQLFVSMIQSILYFLCSNQATHTHTRINKIPFVFFFPRIGDMDQIFVGNSPLNKQIKIEFNKWNTIRGILWTWRMYFFRENKNKILLRLDLINRCVILMEKSVITINIKEPKLFNAFGWREKWTSFA